MEPSKLGGRYSSIVDSNDNEWEKDKFYERTVNFHRPPSPKGALSKCLRSTMNNVIQRTKEEQVRESYNINPYKVTYLKDAYPVLDKYPAVKLPYSTNLLNDYCQMLHPEINNRDVIIFAMH